MNAVAIDDALLERVGVLRVALRRAVARLHELEGHGTGPWTACAYDRCQKAVGLLADSVCERCHCAFVRGANAVGKFCRNCWDLPNDHVAAATGRDR
jgi:hypothetical protein